MILNQLYCFVGDDDDDLFIGEIFFSYTSNARLITWANLALSDNGGTTSL